MIFYTLFCIIVGALYPILLKIFTSNLNFPPPINTFLILIFHFLYLAYSAFLILIFFKNITQYCLIPIIVSVFFFIYIYLNFGDNIQSYVLNNYQYYYDYIFLFKFQ